MSKPILFTYPGSVWASVPELAIRELGYASGDIVNRVINLGRGENFAPTFLNINPHGTLPTMVVGSQGYTSTADVTSYLVKHAPKPVKPGTSFVTTIHEDKYDPNFPLFLARSDQELEQKGAAYALDLVRDRQDALERYAAQPSAAQHKAFYDSKLASNGALLALYQGTAPDSDKQAFFHKSTTHWDTLNKFVSEELATVLPDTPFFGGGNPGEDDFHLAAWLARIAYIVGDGGEQDGVRSLQSGFGIELHPKSWQEVYAHGLH
ncbi:hypothetical protein OG21DRAFT_1474229 [Imleria badia]|nr:hypothetical protein OG21DRAFT_1474229 [Imleria badia]